MTNYKTDGFLFKIDYNKYSLLKNPETGLFTDPISSDEFDRFAYWSDEFNQPVRQIICKNEHSHYADYLDLTTATLKRQVKSTLGVSAYDDEISKAQYEELCQIALLKHNYHNHINNEILLPFQSLTLSFFKFKEEVLIKKVNTVFVINYKQQRVEKKPLISGNIISKAKKISEYEFYFSVIQKLIEKNGQEFLSIKI